MMFDYRIALGIVAVLIIIFIVFWYSKPSVSEQIKLAVDANADLKVTTDKREIVESELPQIKNNIEILEQLPFTPQNRIQLADKKLEWKEKLDDLAQLRKEEDAKRRIADDATEKAIRTTEDQKLAGKKEAITVGESGDVNQIHTLANKIKSKEVNNPITLYLSAPQLAIVVMSEYLTNMEATENGSMKYLDSKIVDTNTIDMATTMNSFDGVFSMSLRVSFDIENTHVVVLPPPPDAFKHPYGPTTPVDIKDTIDAQIALYNLNLVSIFEKDVEIIEQNWVKSDEIHVLLKLSSVSNFKIDENGDYSYNSDPNPTITYDTRFIQFHRYPDYKIATGIVGPVGSGTSLTAPEPPRSVLDQYPCSSGTIHRLVTDAYMKEYGVLYHDVTVSKANKINETTCDFQIKILGSLDNLLTRNVDSRRVEFAIENDKPVITKFGGYNSGLTLKTEIEVLPSTFVPNDRLYAIDLEGRYIIKTLIQDKPVCFIKMPSDYTWRSPSSNAAQFSFVTLDGGKFYIKSDGLYLTTYPDTTVKATRSPSSGSEWTIHSNSTRQFNIQSALTGHYLHSQSVEMRGIDLSCIRANTTLQTMQKSFTIMN